MKIEAGKYYKRRDGKLGGVAVIVDGDFPVRCGGNFYDEDGYFYNSNIETDMDLVEECNADGSPVEKEDHFGTASWETTVDKLRREEVALKVLTAMIASPPVCNRAEVDKEKWCNTAFEWADAFIKVAKRP